MAGVATNLLMICSYFLQKAVGFEIKDYSLNSGSYSAAQQATACSWFDLVAIISAVSGVLLAIVMLFYPLSRKKHQQVVDVLMAKGIITNVDAEQQNANPQDDAAMAFDVANTAEVDVDNIATTEVTVEKSEPTADNEE